MSITTEQAEQMAEICDQLGGFAQCAAALRSLAAEREQLQAEIEKLRAALREIRNKARTGRPPFMSSKTDFFQIASKALGEKQ
jgi:cell division protein FtsB